MPSTLRTSRNDTCPCGSGKKFKQCCYGQSRFRAKTPRFSFSSEAALETRPAILPPPKKVQKWAEPVEPTITTALKDRAWQRVHFLVDKIDGKQAYVTLFYSVEWLKATGVALLGSMDVYMGRWGYPDVSGPAQVRKMEPYGRNPFMEGQMDAVIASFNRVESAEEAVALFADDRQEKRPLFDGEKVWALNLVLEYSEGRKVDITLLRPESWRQANRPEVGSKVFLDLPEMGVQGWARVLSLVPNPHIESGPGSVVTGTFCHSHGIPGELFVNGESEPIGVTPGHLFWSVDRNDWVPAGELRKGETLKTISGTTTVESFTMGNGPPEPVYNLEVWPEHVYRVGDQGLLVHNISNACNLFSPQSFGVGGTYNTPGGPRYNIGSNGRAEKSEARVCTTGGGQAAYQNPVGWNPSWNSGLAPGQRRVARCHLLGAQLGGAGSRNNLVPCCHSCNLMMEMVENQVAAFITANGCVDVQVTATYSTPGRTIPDSITFLAKGEQCSTGMCRTFTITINNPSALTQCPVV